jgi:small conductance mechanosensitive channel
MFNAPRACDALSVYIIPGVNMKLSELNIDQYVEQAPGLVIKYGGMFIVALLIFVIGKWLARLISNMLVKAMEKKQVDITITRFVGSLVYGALFTFVIVAALSQLGIETTSFIAVLGAAGLAVGLALQGSLSNFASGVLLIMFRPLRAGDFVEVAGVAGVVEEVGIFTTNLSTGDNKAIIIPNSGVMGGTITNYSLKPTRRVDLVIGISYDADIRRAKEVLQQITSADKRILPDPETTIAVAELADSSVNFNVRPWVKSADYWPVKSDLLEAIKTRFDEEGIGIPYPQVDVHIDKSIAS